MAVSLNYLSQITTDEQIDTNVPGVSAANRHVRHTLFDTSLALNGSSTPKVSKCAFFTKALTAGAATIDLTALPGTNGGTVDLTGLKVRAIKIRASGSNANPLTVKNGASNGYGLDAAESNWTLVLDAGQEALIYTGTTSVAVGSGAKTIDLAGTGTQSVDVAIFAGGD